MAMEVAVKGSLPLVNLGEVCWYTTLGAWVSSAIASQLLYPARNWRSDGTHGSLMNGFDGLVGQYMSVTAPKYCISFGLES